MPIGLINANGDFEECYLRSEIQKRTHKGKSILELPSNYVILDIETTGLDPNFDEIIEIGAVKFENDVKISDFQSLVKPTHEIDNFIIDLTGITNEMLHTAPSLKEVLPMFLEFVGSDILVAHNANFDINFIYDNSVELIEKPLTNDYIDTLRLSRRIFPELKSHRLKILVKHFNLSSKPSHRSLADCYSVYELLLHIKNYINTTDFDLSKLVIHKKQQLHASEITAEFDKFDESHPLFGKCCVFTGTLEKMLRKEAMQLVANIGGINGDGVTTKTNYLILGNNDYCSTIKDGKSAKHKKAEKYILDGLDIEILSENVFYDLVLE